MVSAERRRGVTAMPRAFAAFIDGAVKSYGLDPKKLVYVGYSNGANLLNSLLYLHPNLVQPTVFGQLEGGLVGGASLLGPAAAAVDLAQPEMRDRRAARS